ncbi:hypothetical protein NXW08_14205 [Bacteroides uniformis]|uniref:pectate lyase n=1 Tax=Bacteroides uniformis TaxID=820 RepID=UPI0021652A78|nr:pectate lyase [Bacteroides uniformis]MCS2724524.1 hypothetical protein [Bacteroides uniformis]
MEEKIAKEVIDKLITHIQKEKYKGYDPYDTLNSFIPFKLFGSFVQAAAIQFQLRNPINIRKIIGIKKEYSVKSLGLILHAYAILYSRYPSKELLVEMNFLFDLIYSLRRIDNRFKGWFWAVHYPIVWKGRNRPKFDPSSVLASTIFEGVFEYYRITNNEKAKEVLLGIAEFIQNCIPTTETEHGKCYSYTTTSSDIIFNANAFVCEVLAKCYFLTHDKQFQRDAIKSLNFTVYHQKKNGSWMYRYYPDSGKEKNQIDFHQGFILNSLNEAIHYLSLEDKKYIDAIKKGYDFYINKQFTKDGRGMWRYPVLYPIDIHNQAVGIITFSKMSTYSSLSKDVTSEIIEYTLSNLYNKKKGYFYYQKRKFFTNRIDYIRWNQSWMLLALAYYIKSIK